MPADDRLSVELVMAQFGSRADQFEPSLSSFKRYLPEASVTLYTDRDVALPSAIDTVKRVDPPYSPDDPRYGWRSCDFYKVFGLLESRADVAIAVDCDMLVVSDRVRSLLALSERFGLCLPANPRLLVRIDTLIGADSDTQLDETDGCGFALNSTPIAFATKHRSARVLLEWYMDEMLRHPGRAPLALWRASWATGFAPCVLPFQWCVCLEHVGIGDEIILHVGHEKVRQFYAADRPAR